MLTLIALFLMSQDRNFELSVQERFRVEFVLLDVVAQDRRGNLITDLTAADFSVTENRKPVEVSYFDILDFREGVVPDLTDVPEHLHAEVKANAMQQIVIAIDLIGVQEIDTQKIFKQLDDFVKSLDPNQEYRINVYSMERGSISKGFLNTPRAAMDALGEFRDRHLASLERARSGGVGGGTTFDWDGNSQHSSRARAGFSMLGDDWRLSELEEAFQQCRSFFSSDYGALSRCIGDSLGEYMDRMSQRTDRIMGELELLTYDFEDTAGLKLMLFVSPGFGMDYMSSAVDLAYAYLGRSQDAFLDASSGKLDVRSDFRRVVHACIKNRVVFHTFDIFNGSAGFLRNLDVRFSGAAGSRVTRAYRNFSFDMSNGLRSLAEESGGSFHQVARLEGGMNKVLDNNRFFYVIGYGSPIASDGEFRKIKVKVNRRGVKVRHRTGYFARQGD